MAKVILDTVRKIEFDSSNPPLSNLHALSYLPRGIISIAHEVHRFEKHVEDGSYLPPGADLIIAPTIDRFEIIACWFSWYCVSIHNYLRLVALVELVSKKNWSIVDVGNPKNSKTIKTHCTNYVEEVIPEINRWRNKIAAHFAITAPFNSDNQALLEFSAMNNITYSKPHFYAGALQYCSEGTESDLPKWSVTETFSTLAPRLWPHLFKQ
jgi:hypothetical protein